MSKFAGAFRSDFLAIAESHRDDTALVSAKDGAALSYGELAALATGFAKILREKLPEGGLIVVALPNSIETLVVFLGALVAGFDYMPIATSASEIEASRALSVVKPSLAVFERGSVPSHAVLSRCSHGAIEIPLDGMFEWVEACEEGVLRLSTERSSRLYLSTSGSTGQPKAMVVDSDTLWRSGQAFIAEFPAVTKRSRFFNCLPMHYMAGLYNLFLIPMSLGSSIVVGEAFSARSMLTFWRDVEKYEVDVLWLVPAIVRGLLRLSEREGTEANARSGRKIILSFLGTAPIEAVTKRRFEERFGIPLLENYALSETLFISSEVPAGANREIANVGKPLPFISLRLGESGGAVQARPPSPQPVFVKTPYLMLGYTDETGALDLPGDDGWFPTGDLGRLTDGGELVLEGRTRDIIKRSGVMIALREIECIVQEHPAIREAVAYAIPHPDYGEDYILAVDTDLAENEVKTWVWTRLGGQKRPSAIQIASDFPRTASGKIKKHELTNRWRQLGAR